MFKRIRKYFSIPKRLTVLNLILIIAILVGNTLVQVFCIPTTWTIILLSICFVNAAFFPLTSTIKWLLPFASFLNGITLFIFIYCILFLGYMNLAAPFLIMYFGLGLLVFVPYFFVIQILWNNLIKPVSKTVRYFFLAGVFCSIISIVLIGFEYKKQLSNFKNFEATDFEVLDEGYLTERILGMHFIYHTKFCEYDGWRPPKHDPILVIGMWLNHGKDPLDIDLKDRLALYKKFYPENQVKFDCSCAVQYSWVYHSDHIWE